MDALVEFLFKYRPIVFEKGHLVFGASWPARLVVLILGVAALAAVATYLRVRIRGTPSDRFVLGGIRVAALILLILVLLRPMLLVSAALSQRNVVGVLIDDSRSMQVPDMGGRTRADVVRSLLGGPDSALYKSLAKRFVVRLFQMQNNGSQIKSVGDLPFNGARTQFAPALENVREDLAGAPVAGFVLASDGDDNAPDVLSKTLVSLNARHIPVFTVGVGQERFAKDIEVSDIQAPRTVLKGTAIIMNVDVTQRGFGGDTVKLVVEDSGHIVASQSVVFPRTEEAMRVYVRVPAAEAGARLLTVSIAPQAGEMVKENNTQTALVVVQDRRDKILYVSGEFLFDLKYMRLALDDDENLQLVALQRTSKDKFLRLGVDNANELAAGFPKTREELFGYQGIVLESIEASYFTFDQLQMISDFVSERGGGLLMMGGRQSFAEGGYSGTPVADALPVVLPMGHNGKPVFHDVKVNVTPVGAISAVTQISGSEDASVQQWQKMPGLTSVNAVTLAKAGATTLLDAPGSGGGRDIVLAHQRFGRGEAFAFPMQDSWTWQMNPNTPIDDKTYTTFMRQTLRSLVNDVPDRVTVSTNTDRAWLNEPVQVSATVFDQKYAKVDGAEVTATIHTPSGATMQQRLEESTARDGEYHTAYTPTERGVYSVQVSAKTSTGPVLSSQQTFVDAGTPTTEYIGAELRGSLLQRIAEETGGRYYTPATAKGLAEDLMYTGSGNTTVERLDVWDMPIILIILLALVAGEWGYRRARRLA